MANHNDKLQQLEDLKDLAELNDSEHMTQDPLNPDITIPKSFEDANVFVNYDEVGKTNSIHWRNNYTRLNEYNMNHLVSFVAQYADWATEQGVRYYAKEVIVPLIEDLIKHSAGWNKDSTVTPAEHGEIFNDYKDNQANEPYSSVFGENNKSSSKHQFVLGKFNADDEDAVLIAGWGDNSGKRKNIATIRNTGIPTLDTDLVNKGYFDIELSRLKQLNQWIGNLTVSSSEFDLENNNAKLKPLLTEFVLKNSPSKRNPRNGDLVTVTIDPKESTDPEYPEIWIFLEDDPSTTGEDDHAGNWEFYSSLQQIVNASTEVKGLVQISKDPDSFIEVRDGVISAYQYWIDF